MLVLAGIVGLEKRAIKNQDHVFVSYASEDIALAEWLTFKLTALGYKVWCDRIKLFGGESYPKDIDAAIKNRTFRFLALLSHASLNKPNPLKERTTALNIAEERKEDFVIPLNLGVNKPELPWQFSDLTWVDFSKNWATGLAGLLKALRKAKTPCKLENCRDIVSNSIISEEIVRNKPEKILSNFLTIKKIPEAISVIRLRNKLHSHERKQLQNIWACRKISYNTFLSFHKPPDEFPYEVQNAHLWENANEIEGIDTHDIVSELLRKNLNCHCCVKGLLWSNNHKWLYFPFGITSNDRLYFVDLYGKKNNIKVCGERTFFTPGKLSKYRYYLAPTFRILRNMIGEEFVVKVGLRIRITNTMGVAITWISAQARRKHVSRDWWNYEWVNRYLALCSFLSNENDEIVIGEQEPYKLVFSARLLSYMSSISLDEVKIDERQKERKDIVI